MRKRARLLALVCVFFLVFGTAMAHADEADGYDKTRPELLTADQLRAVSCILEDAATGEVLFEKDADRRMAPASTTKVMTLMLALEAYADLGEYVAIPAEAKDIPADSSKVPVTVGEEMRVADLLYGLMLASGNDAAMAIAVLVDGSVEAFVRHMNRRAEELGCVSTHYANPHGYTADNHYTTAREMALITREAMKDPRFTEIVSTGTYVMTATNKRGALTIKNSNLFATGNGYYHYKYATGVKTGTTTAAGQCLVGSATNDIGAALVSVVFKSTINEINAKWVDTTRLMEYGFTKYEKLGFGALYERRPITVQVKNASAADGGALALDALINRASSYARVCYLPHMESILDEVMANVEVSYEAEVAAPILKGTILGELRFTAPDGEITTAVLTASRDVEAAPSAAASFFGLFRGVPGWLVAAIAVLALALIWMVRASRKKARLRKKRRARQAAAARRRAQQ